MRTVPNDAMLNADKDVVGVVQLLEVNEATHLRWRTQSGDMNAEESQDWSFCRKRPSASSNWRPSKC
jgi:hypothetical protein